ncbi:leucine-rich repeat protein [Perkinsela sp. CCAP 1560/4]|nr:leucine-rich repeat protein [Perkinsela sp. CCAP 1560/4]|eukprot:KNH04043.1 leucine-rich repeat protein [Perkinsela sp. CCAP 1560/4]
MRKSAAAFLFDYEHFDTASRLSHTGPLAEIGGRAQITMRVQCSRPTESGRCFLSRCISSFHTSRTLCDNHATLPTHEASTAFAWHIEECDCCWPNADESTCISHRNGNSKWSKAGEVRSEKFLDRVKREVESDLLGDRRILHTGLNFEFPRKDFHREFTSLFSVIRNVTAMRIRMNAVRSFPFAALPRTLQALDVRDSTFCGPVEWAKLPRGLQYIDLTNNDFTGDITMKDVPEGIRREGFYIDNNQWSAVKHPDYTATPGPWL